MTMKRQAKKRCDVWAGRRVAFFASNKILADKLAKQRGGKCLSGPQPKNAKWVWKCKDPCHKAWTSTFFQVAGTGKRKGSWCKACAGDSWTKRRKMQFAENKRLADKLAKNRSGKCLSAPRRKHDKWRWRCNEPDHRSWLATLAQVQGCGQRVGSWCPRCAGRDVPGKIYRAWARRFGGRLIQQARTTTEEAIWWCKNHKNEFSRSLNNMQTTNSFCPDCNTSLGERKCKAAMEQLFGVKFVKQRLPDLKGLGGKALEIDLYNDQLKLGLEHQGAQHFIKKKFFGKNRFEAVQEHDRRKRKFCNENGITLIEIRQVGETTPDGQLKEAIRSALLKKNFPLPQGFEKVILSLDVTSIPSLQEEKWLETKTAARKRRWRVVSKQYLGSLTEHQFICDQGHSVKIKPSYLLQGQGCAECECKPVVFDDGQLFSSLSDAAKQINASISAVSKAIIDHGRVRGLRAASVSHKQLRALQSKRKSERRASITALFAKLPVRKKVGEANGKPVLLGDGRMFSSAYEAARVVGVKSNVALAAAKRPKGKIKGIRIAQITKAERDAFQRNPALISEFWVQRPLEPRKLMTR